MTVPSLCTIAAIPGQIQRERITMADARKITGKKSRALRDLAGTHKIPGAVKIGGEWTFNEAKLRSWIDDLEKQQASPCVPVNPKPRVIASGTANSSGGGRRSTGKSADGRYERTIQKLLRNGSKPTVTARPQRPATATPGPRGVTL